MATDLPRRNLRKNLVLDLPKIKPSADGRMPPADFEHYTRVLNEWARDVSDRQRNGIWVPSLHAVTTDPTMGTTPTLNGDWEISGQYVYLRFVIAFGGSMNAGSGIYTIENLPFRIDFGLGTGGFPVGQAHLRDVGTASRLWTIMTSGETALRIADASNTEMAHNVPWAWGASDNMRGWARYKIAPNHT